MISAHTRATNTLPNRAFAASIAGLVLLLGGGFASAAEQGVTGKKLLLKSTPKILLLSKDASISPGANGSSSDPRCMADGGSGSGASMEIEDSFANTLTLSMPCENWSTNGSGTLYKYKDSSGSPKVAKIKAGLLKVVSPGGSGFPVANGYDGVNVEVTVGSDKYCMSFQGVGDGNQLLAKDQPAPISGCGFCGDGIRQGAEECDGTDNGACSLGGCNPDSCTCPVCTATTGGYCWFLTPFDNNSCDTLCGFFGLGYDNATELFAGSGGSNANCAAVLNDLGHAGSVADVACPAGLGCALSLPFPVTPSRCTSPATTSSAQSPGYYRACACQ